METIVARDGNDGWNELDELMEAIVARAGRVDGNDQSELMDELMDTILARAGRVDGNDRDEKWTN